MVRCVGYGSLVLEYMAVANIAVVVEWKSVCAKEDEQRGVSSADASFLRGVGSCVRHRPFVTGIRSATQREARATILLIWRRVYGHDDARRSWLEGELRVMARGTRHDIGRQRGGTLPCILPQKERTVHTMHGYLTAVFESRPCSVNNALVKGAGGVASLYVGAVGDGKSLS